VSLCGWLDLPRRGWLCQDHGVTETEWAVTSLAAFDADETRTHDLKFEGETLEAHPPTTLAE